MQTQKNQANPQEIEIHFSFGIYVSLSFSLQLLVSQFQGVGKMRKEEKGEN